MFLLSGVQVLGKQIRFRIAGGMPMFATWQIIFMVALVVVIVVLLIVRRKQQG